MKFPRTDPLYKKTLKVKHIRSKDNGVVNAIAIIKAPDWWSLAQVRLTKLMITENDLVVCSWTLYNDGTVEAKTTHAIFRHYKNALIFYKQISKK